MRFAREVQQGGRLARQTDPPEDFNEEDATGEDAEPQAAVEAARTKFFGYLALLSGGGLLLSVSLLGSLIGKVALSAVAVLFAGWIALLIALFGSIFRALKYQPAMTGHETTIPTVRPLALSHRAGDTVPDEDEEDEEPAAEKHASQARISEAFAIHGFWIGTVLLAIFTGYNVVAANHTPAPATPNSSERLFTPPDVSAGSGRAASCAEATRVATACTKSAINTEEVEPFASKGGYQIPLPPIADVPRGFRPDPNPKDCDTAEQWQNYCRQHP